MSYGETHSNRVTPMLLVAAALLAFSGVTGRWTLRRSSPRRLRAWERYIELTEQSHRGRAFLADGFSRSGFPRRRKRERDDRIGPDLHA